MDLAPRTPLAAHPLLGRIVSFAEHDYKFGAGPLRLLVDRVFRGVAVHDGDEWTTVEGVELGYLDQRHGRVQVLVRTSAIPQPRRP